jgi:hypothetical protein
MKSLASPAQASSALSASASSSLSERRPIKIEEIETQQIKHIAESI